MFDTKNRWFLTCAAAALSGCLPQAQVSQLSLATTAPGYKYFVYTTNNSAGTISIYSLNTSTGQMTQTSLVANGRQPNWAAAHPNGKFLFVANQASATLSSYRIDQSNGSLELVEDAPAETGARYPVVHPNGKFVYLANTEAGSVTAYSVDGTKGTLSQIQSIAVGSDTRSVTLSPDGNYLYAANKYVDYPRKSFVTLLKVNAQTGLLELVSQTQAHLGTVHLAIDPSGKFLYTANNDSNDLDIHPINQLTGALVSNGAYADSSIMPAHVGMHPTGNFVYSLNWVSNDITVFSRDASTGLLAQIGKVPTDERPACMAFAPSGDVALVANYSSGTITSYRVQADGQLVPLSDPVIAGPGTNSVVILRVKNNDLPNLIGT